MNLKTITLVLLLSLLLIFCKKEEEDTIGNTNQVVMSNEFENFELNMPVKSVKTIKISISDEAQLDIDTLQNEEITFNKNGLLTHKKVFEKNNLVKDEFYYDGKEQLLKHLKYLNGAIFQTIIYEWNSKRKLYKVIKQDIYNEVISYEKYEYLNDLLVKFSKFDKYDMELEKTVYEYTDNLILEKESKFGRNDKLKIVKKYTFDKNGNLSETVDINNDNEIVLRTQYSYSADKKIENITYLNGNNLIIRAVRKKFDEENRLIENSVIDEQKNQITTINEYYEELITGYKEFENELLINSITYNYDENKFLVETIDDLERDSEFNSKIEYELDDEKNWIKKTVTSKRYPTEITTREIQY